MADIKLTAEQQQAVSNRGGGLLVSAAAGSGKTKVLVERLFARVEEQKCNVDDFLIITYTRAAAAELRGKIAKELTKRVAQEPENDHLRRQLFRVYQADIKTVDAFCGSLLRENIHLLPPIEGRSLTPDYRMLDEQEGQILQERVLNHVMDGFYERLEQGDARGQSLVETLGAGRDDRQLTALVLDLYNKLQSHPYPLKWLQDNRSIWECVPSALSDTPFGQLLMQDTVECVEFWSGRLRRAVEDMAAYPAVEKAYGPSFLSVAQSLLQFREKAESGWSAMGEVDIAFPRMNPVRGEENEACKIRMQELKKRCQKELKEATELFATSEEEHLEDLRAMAPAMLALMDLTAEFLREFRQEKVRRNTADFSDQEHYAIELLTDGDGAPTDLARQVAQRYTEIMVDEYQDTNEVQNSIFRAISRDGENLFMVGDVKQSIYRFRLAQPEIFLQKYETYQDADSAGDGEPRKILLKRNFRSRGDVLEATNFLFRNILSRQIGEMTYGEREQLYTGADYYAAAENRETELHLISVEDTEDEEFSRERVEADFIAGKIRSMLDSEYPVQGEDGRLRPIRPEDVVILMRSPKRRIPAFGAALSRCGIPFFGGEEEPFFETMEVSTVFSLLQIIDNPRQDVPLIAVLRSPLFGFSPDLLAKIRGCSSGDFYEACCACQEEEAKSFLQQLTILRDMAMELPADQLLWQMYDFLHLPAVFGAMENGELRRSRLLSLCGYAESLAAQGKITVFELTEYLRGIMSRGNQPNVASGKSAGGVEIMSIHRSKGLEFPVVILCDLHKTFNREDFQKPVLVHPRLGLGTERVDTQRHIRYSTVSKSAISMVMEKEMLSEEMRLLYVAMTRAKEKLILVDCAKGQKKHVADLAAMTELPAAPRVVREGKSLGDWVLLPLLSSTQAAVLHQWTEVWPEKRESAGSWRVYLHVNPTAAQTTGRRLSDAQQEPDFDTETLRRQYDYMAVTAIPSKITATQLKGRDLDREIAEGTGQRAVKNGDFAVPKFLQEKQGLTAAERGTAMHLVMQYLPFETEPSREAVWQVVDRLRDRRLLTPEQAESIDADRIAAFLQSDLCREIRRATRVWREYRFALLVPASLYDPTVQGEEMMLQGIADVCYRTENGLVVADFKTDRIRPGEENERAAQYRTQLEAYSHALSRVLEEKVTRRVLYFFQTGKAVEI